MDFCFKPTYHNSVQKNKLRRVLQFFTFGAMLLLVGNFLLGSSVHAEEKANEEIITKSTKTPAEVINEMARTLSVMESRRLMDELMSKLNSAPNKLGYEVGSTLTVKLPNSSKFFDRESPRGFWFKGWSTIQDIRWDSSKGDPSIGSSYDPYSQEFTLWKIKDQTPTGDATLLMTSEYSYQTWEWYTLFWVRLEDRSGVSFGETYPTLKFTNFEKSPK